LTLLSGGLRNIGINAGTVLDLTSQAAWSAAIDKKYDLVQQLVVLKFNIGPIPVRIWFEIPVEIKADARFSENAHAQVGVTGQLNIGDAYLEWTPSSHWVVHKPTPSFTWAPVLSGDANFYGHVDFAIIPTLTMHIDNLFDYSITLGRYPPEPAHWCLTCLFWFCLFWEHCHIAVLHFVMIFLSFASIFADPTLHLDIKGQAKAVPPAAKLCADLSYDATIVSNAHLTIDIPWLFIVRSPVGRSHSPPLPATRTMARAHSRVLLTFLSLFLLRVTVYRCCFRTSHSPSDLLYSPPISHAPFSRL